jgi:hypothetical protein
VSLRGALLLTFCLGGAGAAAAQPAVTSPAPGAIEVTVYRDPDRGERAMNIQWLNGFALISERRRVRIPAGESVVRFEGVAGGIVPQSAIVTGFPDGIVERNRDAYLLSPATLIDRSLGRRVHLRRTSATGEVREQEAVVRSGAGGAVVLETADGIEALRCTGVLETIVYDEVPAGLSPKPTLSVRTRAAAPVDAEVTLSYLATGFDWQANYIAQLSADGRRIDLFAWLTLASQDQTSFPDADTQAVAGRVNYTRAQVPPAEGGALQLRCWSSATTSDVPLEDWAPPPASLPPGEMAYEDGENITVTGSRVRRSNLGSVAMIAQQEELGDLKLYRIPEPVTVAANAQKQVALLARQRVPVEIAYRLRVDAQDPGDLVQATRFLVTRNREKENLGLPLPSGAVALFADHGGRRILIGQGRLDDRAVGDDVEIGFAPSASVQARIEQVTAAPDDHWTDYRMVVTNDQNRPVRFEAEFARSDGTRLVPRTRLGERDGMALWAVNVPAGGTATLRYRVEQPGGG